MITIRSLLQNKKPLVSVSADQMVFAAVLQMTDNDIGAVLIMDETGRIAGIFTERDSLKKITRPGLDPQTTPLRSVMTTHVCYAKPEQSVEDCLRLMTERHFRHLPVLDEQQNILGLVSIGDLVKARLVEQEFMIDQMEHYIADSLPVQR